MPLLIIYKNADSFNQGSEDWLQAQVAAGRFASLDEALADAVDGLRAEEEALTWAKPLVDEGLAELNRGESVPADEVFASIEAGVRTKG